MQFMQKFNFAKIQAPLLRFVISNNLALCYQARGGSGFKRATKCIDKAIKALAAILRLPDPSTLNLSSRNSHKMLVFDKTSNSCGHTQHMKLLFLVVRGYLQQAALLSQCQEHDSALESVKLAKYYLKVLVYNLDTLIKIYNKDLKSIEKRVEFKHEDEKAYFSAFLQVPELKKFNFFCTVHRTVDHDMHHTRMS